MLFEQEKPPRLNVITPFSLNLASYSFLPHPNSKSAAPSCRSNGWW